MKDFHLDLNDDNLDGINYFACILEQFKNTNEIWYCLEKLKIRNVLKQTITKLSNDHYHSNRYSIKRAYLLENKKGYSLIKTNNEWKNFRPLLELFTVVENDYLNSKNTNTIKNKQEAIQYYSLKIISEIDNSK